MTYQFLLLLLLPPPFPLCASDSSSEPLAIEAAFSPLLAPHCTVEEEVLVSNNARDLPDFLAGIGGKI